MAVATPAGQHTLPHPKNDWRTGRETWQKAKDVEWPSHSNATTNYDLSLIDHRVVATQEIRWSNSFMSHLASHKTQISHYNFLCSCWYTKLNYRPFKHTVLLCASNRLSFSVFSERGGLWTPVSKTRFSLTIFQSGWKKPSHSSSSLWWVFDEQ